MYINKNHKLLCFGDAVDTCSFEVHVTFEESQLF